MRKKAAFLRRQVKNRWSGKVIASECYSDSYDVEKGFRVVTPVLPKDSMRTREEPETLQEAGITVLPGAKEEYEKHK